MSAPTRADLLSEAREAMAAAQADRSAAIDDWAAQHILHPRGSGPAPHDPRITPYWRHWLDIARARLLGERLEHDPHATQTEQIYLVCGNQLGKTLGLLLVLWAWALAVAPRATGIVLPRLDDLRRTQRARARPLLDLSARLRGLIPGGLAEQERRLGGRSWQLVGSTTHWLNGGAAIDLRSLDLPLLLADEFDAFAEDIDGEGDPLELLLDRQKTYPLDRLLVGATTPTRVAGHGWRRLCSGSHERLLLACPECGAHHWPDPRHLWGPADATPDDMARDDLARWICPTCTAASLTTTDLHRALAQATAQPGWSAAGGWCPGAWNPDDRSPGGGRWEPAAPRDARGHLAAPRPPGGSIRTGWLNSLYSPWISLGQYLAHQRRANHGAEADRVAHVNGWDGEPHSPLRDAIAEADLVQVAAGSAYQHGSAPHPCRWIIATLDQQGQHVDRCWFPYVIRGYDQSGASWLIEAGRVDGWDAATALMTRPLLVGGQARNIDLASMDAANGGMVRSIRTWCAADPRRRISLAMSGTMAPDHPYSWEQASAKNAHRLCGLPCVYVANAHHYRDELLATMRAQPRRWHLPADAPPWYTDSLTAEERVPTRRLVRGRVVEGLIWRPRTYALPNGRVVERTDNHWWDCEVQQVALVSVLRLFDAPATTPNTAAAWVRQAARRP